MWALSLMTAFQTRDAASQYVLLAMGKLPPFNIAHSAHSAEHSVLPGLPAFVVMADALPTLC